MLVQVQWLDAHCALDRITRADAGSVKPVLTHSVGHLVSQNDDGIVIAVDSYPSEDGAYACWHFVPKLMIVSITELVGRGS